MNLIELNSLDDVSYIRVPNYREYAKLIGMYPDTAVLHNTSWADFPIIICRTPLRKTEWMLFDDYCEEVERLTKK